MRAIAIMGPAGAGRTTLAARLGALEGGARRTELDRGLALTRFGFLGEPWCALDCPGGAEAMPDVRAALLAADAAVIVAPPDPEAAAFVAPWLRAAEEAGTPALIFVNRMDAPHGRLRDIVAALQDFSRHVLVLRQIPMREGEQVVGAIDLVSERAWRYRDGAPSALVDIPESARAREHEARAELLEHLSDFDDWLLEEIVEDRAPPAEPLYALCAKMMAETRATTVFFGAAQRGSGAMRLMKALRHETPGPEALRARLATAKGAPLAVAFHARWKPHVGKAVEVRALAEGVAQGAPLGGAGVGGLHGPEGEGAGPLAPGAAATAVKSDQLSAGRVYAAGGAAPAPAWSRGPAPVSAHRIVPVQERDDAKLSAALSRMAEADPGLSIGQEAASGAHLARVQGPRHLRRLLETLAEVHGVAAEAAPPAEDYRETITRPAQVHYRHRKQTGGAGQFADVVLGVAPAPRGAGFAFRDTVKGGAVPRGYIPAVEAGARDALARGPLGFAVEDIAVTLLDGRAHSVDSSDLAFRTAGRMAVAQALAEAGPVLLQPVLAVRIHAPATFGGGLAPLVASHRGQVQGFDADGEARGWDVLRAAMPGGAVEDLLTALRSATQGTAWLEAAFDHYETFLGREAERVAEARRAAS